MRATLPATMMARDRTNTWPRTVVRASTRVCDAAASSWTAEITEMSSIVWSRCPVMSTMCFSRESIVDLWKVVTQVSS
ncbi:hypothetical protein D3C74_481710 [compost metagenome]